MKSLYLLLLLFFFLVCTASLATTDSVHNDSALDDVFVKANELYLEAKFDDGISLIQEQEKSHSQDPAISFFTANGYWWKIFRAYIYDKEAKTTDFDKAFEGYLQQTIDRCEALLKKNKRDVRALFYLGNAYSLKSRVRGLRGSYFSAGRDAGKGKSHLEEVLKIQSSLYDAYYNIGVYNYLAGTLPGYAKVLKALLFLPGGKKEDGLSMLKVASEKSLYFGPEAKLILARFYADFEEEPFEAIKIVEEFHKRYPDNAWFHYWLGTLYSDEITGYETAEIIYNEILDKCKQGVKSYTIEIQNQTSLKLARVKARQLQPEQAIEDLKVLIASNPKNPSWILARAYMELGNTYDQIGMRNKALAAYNQVLQLPDHRKSHEQASNLKTQRYDQRNADIYRLNLEGRRLAAAGKYEEAEKVFQGVLQKYPNNDQTLYAMAETYYLKSSYKEALALLQQIIKRNPKEPKWLMGGVYVRLGQIYQAMNQSRWAQESYRKALESKYLTSDDRTTARLALKQINETKSG